MNSWARWARRLFVRAGIVGAGTVGWRSNKDCNKHDFSVDLKSIRINIVENVGLQRRSSCSRDDVLFAADQESGWLP